MDGTGLLSAVPRSSMHNDFVNLFRSRIELSWNVAESKTSYRDLNQKLGLHFPSRNLSLPSQYEG